MHPGLNITCSSQEPTGQPRPKKNGISKGEGIIYAVMHALPAEKLSKLDDGQLIAKWPHWGVQG